MKQSKFRQIFERCITSTLKRNQSQNQNEWRQKNKFKKKKTEKNIEKVKIQNKTHIYNSSSSTKQVIKKKQTY